MNLQVAMASLRELEDRLKIEEIDIQALKAKLSIKEESSKLIANEIQVLKSKEARDKIISPEPKSHSYGLVHGGRNYGKITDNLSWLEESCTKEGVSYSKHGSFLQAQTALEQAKIRPIVAKPLATPLDYTTVFSSNPKQKSKLTSLGKVPEVSKFTISFRDDIERSKLRSINEDQFRSIYNKILSEDGTSYEKDWYFQSSHKVTKAKYNFREGANPDLIYRVFYCGLIDTIYPGEDLKELDRFPQNMRRAIQRFKERIIRLNEQIFIKCISTTAHWDQNPVNGEDIFFEPYHVIRIGKSSKKRLMVDGPKVIPKFDGTREEISDMAGATAVELIKEVAWIKRHGEIFINFDTSKILMYSLSSKKTSDRDVEKIDGFQKGLNLFDQSTKAENVFTPQSQETFQEVKSNSPSSSSSPTTPEDKM